MIRKAKLSEIPEILTITRACAKHMEHRGIFQWNEHYPSHEAFEKDVQRSELYVYQNQGKIIAGIVISTLMDEEYTTVDWLTENENNIYIHRLFVHPDFQAKGNAQKLMDFAENHAKTNSFESIRLDTFSQNARNQRFYETRGYQKLSDIYFPKQSEHPFHCYELVL